MNVFATKERTVKNANEIVKTEAAHVMHSAYGLLN